jgi:hypothetical protein
MCGCSCTPANAEPRLHDSGAVAAYYVCDQQVERRESAAFIVHRIPEELLWYASKMFVADIPAAGQSSR